MNLIQSQNGLREWANGGTSWRWNSPNLEGDLLLVAAITACPGTHLRIGDRVGNQYQSAISFAVANMTSSTWNSSYLTLWYCLYAKAAYDNMLCIAQMDGYGYGVGLSVAEFSPDSGYIFTGVDVSGGNSTAGTSVNLSLSTTNAKDLLFLFGINSGNARPTILGGLQPLPVGSSTYSGLVMAYEFLSATGTYSPGISSTAGSNGLGIVSVAFKEALYTAPAAPSSAPSGPVVVGKGAVAASPNVANPLSAIDNCSWSWPTFNYGSAFLVQSQGAGQDPGQAVSLPFDRNIAAGNGIAVAIVYNETTDGVPTPASTKGDTLTLLYKDPTLVGGFNTAIFWCPSAVGGATAITYTSGSQGSSLSIAEFTPAPGLSFTGTVDVSGHAESANNLSLVTTNANDLCLVAGYAGTTNLVNPSLTLTPPAFALDEQYYYGVKNGDLVFLGHCASTNAGPVPVSLTTSQYASLAVIQLVAVAIKLTGTPTALSTYLGLDAGVAVQPQSLLISPVGGAEDYAVGMQLMGSNSGFSGGSSLLTIGARPFTGDLLNSYAIGGASTYRYFWLQNGAAASPTVSEIQRYTGAHGSGTTASITLNAVAAGNLLVIGVMWGTADINPPTLSGNGNIYNIRPSLNAPEAGPYTIQMYDVLSANPGNTTILATFDASMSFIEIIAWEFHTSAGVWTFDNGLVGTGTGTAPSSGNFTNVSSVEVLASYAMTLHTGFSGGATGWTYSQTYNQNGMESKLLTSVGPNAATYTLPNSDTYYVVLGGWYPNVGNTQAISIADFELQATYAAGGQFSAAPVTISPPGGYNDVATRVRLSCATANVNIYYTLDGSNPKYSSSAQLYSGPFILNSPAWITAVAIGNGLAPSRLSSVKLNIGSISPLDLNYEVGRGGYRLWAVSGRMFYDPNTKAWYLFGYNFDTAYWFIFAPGLNIYKSGDLRNWTYVATILQGLQGNGSAHVGGQDGLNFSVGDRAFCAYNALNNNYVLWARSFNFGMKIFTASAVGGPFTLASATPPNLTAIYNAASFNSDSDFCGFIDSDNSGYFVGLDSTRVLTAKMTTSYQDADGTNYIWLDSNSLYGRLSEGFGLFKYNGVYYQMSSDRTQLYPNVNFYVRNSVSPLATLAQWSARVNPFQTPAQGYPLANFALSTQNIQGVPIPGRAGTLYCGDDWAAADPYQQLFSIPLWKLTILPYTFDGSGNGAINWFNTWSFDSQLTPSGTGAPAAPTGLTLSGTSTASASWTNNEPGAHSLYLDRATDSGFTTNLASEVLAQGTTSFVDSTIATSTTYYYRVRAVNASGTTVSATATFSGAPTAQAFVNIAGTWNPVTQISTNNAGTWVPVLKVYQNQSGTWVQVY